MTTFPSFVAACIGCKAIESSGEIRTCVIQEKLKLEKKKGKICSVFLLIPTLQSIVSFCLMYFCFYFFFFSFLNTVNWHVNFYCEGNYPFKRHFVYGISKYILYKKKNKLLTVPDTLSLVVLPRKESIYSLVTVSNKFGSKIFPKVNFWKKKSVFELGTNCLKSVL